MSNSLCVNPGQSGVDVSDQDRSIVLPADSQGGVRVIYQSCSGCGGNPSLHSEWANFQGSTGSDETIAPSVMNTDEFSAVNDPTFGMHVAYRTTDGKVAYEYRSATGSLWSPPSLNLFGGVVNYPTISVDYSTNDLYIAGIATGSPTSSIVMKSKSLSQNWTDVSPVYPVMGRKNPAFLTSNAISASYTNASQILLLWTEGPGTSGSYNVTFAYVPIQTVWSPYAAPTDPWDNNGISPYGQYFANLGESVSPMTGMLTVVQTDLSIPGRGIDLSIARAYIEPYSFLNNQPYLYEKYPWAPMGDGWQLNFPWMNNTNAPLYIHLWNGEAYRIPSSFWKGPIANFENHQGDNFRLVRNTDNTIVLYTASGGSYSFDSSHRLTSIIDTTANNTISFIYSNNLISCLTDTASRAYTFSYSSGLLSSVQQINGTCGSPGSTVRRILYGNNGQSLTSVTDPGNRVTSYAYQATSGTVAPWLLSRITFPTGSYSNYTYTAYAMGTTANSYRVTKQYLASSTNVRTRESDFQYSNGAGDRVNNSTVTSYNGTATQPISFTTYAFSFAGVTMNVSDSNHQFARGIQDRFGLNGEIPREIVLVSATNLWYWTNAQPGSGWNSLTKWSLASWKPSPTVANYGSAPWGNINGWQDSKAKWIWWDPNAATSTSVGSTWFRTTFTLPISASIGIEATADDSFTLYIDGKHILAGNNWSTRYYNTTSLGAGVYALAVAANNAQGAAGVIASVRDLATGNVIFRTDASVGSYTNFYRYDLWGNLIYSRSAISPAANWYHENFNSYYNDGLQPGFNAFQDTFSQIQGTSPDNPWSVLGGLWQVQSGVGFMDNNFTSGWTRIQGTGSFTTNGDVGVMVNGVTGVGEQWGKGVPGSLNTSMFTRITVRFASDSGINPSVNVLYTDSTFDAFTLAGGTGQGKYQVQSDR